MSRFKHITPSAGILLLLIFVGLVLPSCNNSSERSKKLLIVTTTGIIANSVENIVGDQAEVISLMGAGVDPHLYKPSQGDMQLLAKADVIIHNGLHLEGKMAKLLSKLTSEKMVLAVADGVKKSDLRKLADNTDIADPHIWLNPLLWVDGMDAIAKRLSTTETLQKIDSKWLVFRNEILELDSVYKSKFERELPLEKRILITSHDAFYYFGAAYQFQVKGLQGTSTVAEYSIKEANALVDFIIQNKIKAIFVETSVSQKSLQAIVKACEAKKYEVKIGGTLYSDALGDKNSGADTYLGMLRANFDTIIAHLK